MDHVEWLSQIEPHQLAKLSDYREKWQVKAASCVPEPATLFNVYIQLATELSLPIPGSYIAFDSFSACASTFDEWSAEAGALPMYWRYQLSLLDPGSYWRLWSSNRDYVHMNIKRMQHHINCALISTPDCPAPTRCLTQELNQTLWKTLTDDWGESDFDEQAYSCIDSHEEFFDELYGIHHDQSPTNQINEWEFVYLGPFNWLVQEVAYADFLVREVNLQGNPIYGPLETIVEHGALLLTFEKLLVVVTNFQTDRDAQHSAAPEIV